MWLIGDFEIRPVELRIDFGGTCERYPTEAVYADGTCLVNATGWVDLRDDPAQVIVCPECGETGCARGGWISLRRVGDFIAWIPAFDRLKDRDWKTNTHAPPEYVLSRGVPLFPPQVYCRLRSQVSAFPPIDQIQRISAGEGLRLLQWEAPLQALGEFPQPVRLNRDVILAVSHGNLEEELTRLQAFIDAHADSEASLVPIAECGLIPIEFYLDGPRFPEWRPFASVGTSVVLLFEPAAMLVVSDEPVDQRSGGGSNMIRIIWRPDYKEFLRAQHYHMRKRTVAVWGAFLGLGVFTWLSSGNPIFFLVILVYLALIRPVWMRAHLRRLWSQTASLHKETQYGFDAKGVHTFDDEGNPVVSHWDNFTGYAETKHAFLLDLGPKMFVCLPKRFFSAEQQQEMRALLAEKLGRTRFGRSFF
ncbi:MAG: YcxB family protein [Planctomycetes bacterium]|nr:YcxB family protein [Planctomycetota bacterium]